MTDDVVHQFISTGKQTIEGIVCFDGCRTRKIALAFQQTHQVTVDLGIHRWFDVHVLRTVGHSSRHATGTGNATAQSGVRAIELHHIALLHGDVIGSFSALGDRLLRTAIHRIGDIARQGDTIVEGDGDLTVCLSHERQRGVLVSRLHIFGSRVLDGHLIGAVSGSIPAFTGLIHVDSDDSIT